MFKPLLTALLTLACVATATLPLTAGATEPSVARGDRSMQADPTTPTPTRLPLSTLAGSMQVGDVVFIRVTARPFLEVAAATGSWTNHVGVVVDVSGAEPLIGESTFPLSRTTPLSRFVARSEEGRVAVSRLSAGMTAAQQQSVSAAAARRHGMAYDTGFNLHSDRQFCSRYVREVMAEATGVSLGEVETFAQLLARRPEADTGFWRAWYLGSIPWQRETVTPAAVLHSAALRPLFDGAVVSRR